jgi:hypothetical protein
MRRNVRLAIVALTVAGLGYFHAPQPLYAYDWYAPYSVVPMACNVQVTATGWGGVWESVTVVYKFCANYNNQYSMYCEIMGGRGDVSCETGPEAQIQYCDGYRIEWKPLPKALPSYVQIPPFTADAQRKLCSGIFEKSNPIFVKLK